MIRFITYVGSWKAATIEGFSFVKGEYLGIPARIAERILLNADFQERSDMPVPPASPSPVEAEPVVEETPEEPVPPSPTDPDLNFDL